MKRSVLLWCLALCLLAGCGARPASAAPVQAPSPTPVQAAAETPAGPVEAMAEAMRSAQGQDFYADADTLGGGDLNGVPGFAEYTGYGLLAQPPGHVSRYRRALLDGKWFEVFVDETDCGAPVAVLITAPGPGGPVQELSLAVKGHMACGWDLRAEDLNFDGLPDVSLDLGGERGGQQFRAALLWDPEAERYREEPGFMDIPSALPDGEHRLFWGGSDFAFGYFYSAHEYVDGALTQTHGIRCQPIDGADWGAGTCCVESALVDGAWVQVGYMEFPDLGGAYPQAFADYRAAGPAWEGWSWCSPWAFFRAG
ncbi:hypothetical protein CE91St41_09930 [Oscillospiraceae bacterium]|nr:hypothetical protein CE91St40_27600 [Oscillospiraceae bacterium]BDF74104.1 hypothetical protein CE91St41_09930 [Oscillospiraceae bacterium]